MMYKVTIAYNNGSKANFTAESMEEIFDYLHFYYKNFVDKINVVYINKIDVNKELNK